MLQKSTIEKILEIFFTEPTTKQYLKKISRKINIAHTSVSKQLKTLCKEKFIKKTIEKKNTREFPYYFANLENEKFKELKKINNLKTIYESKLINEIDEKIFPEAIVLFGSYMRGEDHETSDIDLFIQCEEQQIELKSFEKKLNRKIQLHFATNINKYPTEVQENIINGITLKGFLEITLDKDA